ncbi:MarR family winged helix-turn-helix transcriptional regulator [Desulforhopalus sp. IMCC35007]|uniref:MarR family winged helix-turn-helix transcriptional regulator n=1 Tax=Desulforhopalus sp. IMCC35007 TaxID=2569543 RepID=UPI0010AE74B7|nr:MarR family transcriptional regulator [Desulforhopalus sp. IMCC35007]TKB09691.1 MarR family transcriptional regulator [Desulforhopalus sp. IMCC35007]
MRARSIQEKTITKQWRIVFKAVQAHSRSVERACGLSSAQLWMLHEVSMSYGIKVSELATTLSIHRSTCSNMLDKLEKKQLIYRDRSKSDQRSVHIYIAEQGKELLAHAPSPHQGQLSSTLKKLTDEQLTNLESSLQVFIEALDFDNVTTCMIPIPEV